MALSLLLAKNIYQNLNSHDTVSVNLTSQTTAPKVLGAFDQQSSETPATPAPPTIYTVQKGDTLFNVAQSQGVNWVVIATLNNLKAPYNLKPGTVLKLQ